MLCAGSVGCSTVVACNVGTDVVTPVFSTFVPVVSEVSETSGIKGGSEGDAQVGAYLVETWGSVQQVDNLLCEGGLIISTITNFSFKFSSSVSAAVICESRLAKTVFFSWSRSSSQWSSLC